MVYRITWIGSLGQTLTCTVTATNKVSAVRKFRRDFGYYYIKEVTKLER